MEESETMKKEISFAVITDLHMDIMHDGARRLKMFLKAARDANVDFFISLGDFLYPVTPRTSLCAYEHLPVNGRERLLLLFAVGV